MPKPVVVGAAAYTDPPTLADAVEELKASTCGILLHQRRGVDDSPCTRAAIAGAGKRGGISARRRTDDGGFQHY